MRCDIAVFSADNRTTILPCLRSIDDACKALPSTEVLILLNGASDTTVEIVKQFRPRNCRATVYRFPERDKINAINWYFHSLRRDTNCHICVDGHTSISPGSVEALCHALDSDDRATIASGIPVSGRSADWLARALLAGGANVGNLRAIRRTFVDRLVAAGIKLPLELYRGDGLLGSMAAHDLDPLNVGWDDTRLIGVSNANFRLRPLSAFRPADIRSQYAREIRQARGRMENQAIKTIIYKKGYEGLPNNATDMVNGWLADNTHKTESLREAYFDWRAKRLLSRGPRIHGLGPESKADVSG